jgi:hypothetical protein
MTLLLLFAALVPLSPAQVAYLSHRHPIATECTVNDHVCIATHDAWVTAWAVDKQDDRVCNEATNREACLDAVLAAYEPALNPCIRVETIRRGWATLTYQGRSLVCAARAEWRAGQFVGRCELVDPFADP